MPAQDSRSVRKRKGHTKSRRGCTNCKSRKVKCDESKPECDKCSSYGVRCDYETKSLEMFFPGTGSFQLEVREPAQEKSPAVFDANELIESMLDAPLQLYPDESVGMPEVCHLDKAHINLLRKFHNRTVLTLGTTESVHAYQRILTHMASKDSFVLHAVLRLTLLHDRYLCDPVGTSPSAAEAFHGYHAAAMFSEMLSIETHSSEAKDALWGTYALLGAGTFADIEATCAEEAWPLKPASILDLAWLKMSEGKNTVWRLADPTRKDSRFREIIEAEQQKRRTGPIEQADPALQPLLLYCATLSRSADAGPYNKAASILERLVPMTCSHTTILWFLSFVSYADAAYMENVANKDPTALHLLAVCYAKLLKYGVWWASRRCVFECQAIGIFLNRILPRDDQILSLLKFSKTACGVDERL